MERARGDGHTQIDRQEEVKRRRGRQEEKARETPEDMASEDRAGGGDVLLGCKCELVEFVSERLWAERQQADRVIVAERDGHPSPPRGRSVCAHVTQSEGQADAMFTQQPNRIRSSLSTLQLTSGIYINNSFRFLFCFQIKKKITFENHSGGTGLKTKGSSRTLYTSDFQIFFSEIGTLRFNVGVSSDA